MFQLSQKDFVSVRNEWWKDERGMRSGFPGNYTSNAIGLTHNFTPELQIRPEIGYYRNWTNPAFDLGTKKDMVQYGLDDDDAVLQRLVGPSPRGQAGGRTARHVITSRGWRCRPFQTPPLPVQAPCDPGYPTGIPFDFVSSILRGGEGRVVQCKRMNR